MIYNYNPLKGWKFRDRSGKHREYNLLAYSVTKWKPYAGTFTFSKSHSIEISYSNYNLFLEFDENIKNVNIVTHMINDEEGIVEYIVQGKTKYIVQYFESTLLLIEVNDLVSSNLEKDISNCTITYCNGLNYIQKDMYVVGNPANGVFIPEKDMSHHVKYNSPIYIRNGVFVFDEINQATLTMITPDTIIVRKDE